MAVLQDTENTQNTRNNFQKAITGSTEAALWHRRGTRNERRITDSPWKATDERKALLKQKFNMLSAYWPFVVFNK